MLRWSIVFLVFALVAAVLGFGALASTAGSIAKVLFFGFLLLAIVSFALGRRAPA